MLKRFLEKLSVFKFILKCLSFFARKKPFGRLTQWLTTSSARLNLLLNKPSPNHEVSGLAETWQQLMPRDGQELFKVTDMDERTAYVEIHLHCPLRGTGDVQACYKLMNYDRQLMKKVGGELIVLESQSNSGSNYCKLAIRKAGEPTHDLLPAHMKS